MRIALVDSNPKPKVYPLALLKLGAWQRAEGNECKLYHDQLPGAGDFDEIWITTTFTYDIPHALGIVREARNRAGVVKVGGVAASLLPEHFETDGVQVHRGLVPEAEAFSPDYTLLGVAPEYSITHTSRGCVRKCKFCMVPKLEPEYQDRLDWDRDLSSHTTKVLFYDNNWFAKGIEGIRRDTDKMRALVQAGRITQIDFNQGLDCRLLTDELADLLVGLPLNPVRFAFDGMQEDGHYQRAVRAMAARGFTTFRSYVLYNFNDTPEDYYYRLRQSVELSLELGVDVESFPMRYQPILEIDAQRDYVGKHWTEQQKKAVMRIRAVHTVSGGVSPHSLEEFEYWYGSTPQEFVTLLNYPQIRELCQKKKGALRMKRARARKDV